VHLLRRSQFWSRHNDDDHTIWSAAGEKLRLHTNFAALSGIENFAFFAINSRKYLKNPFAPKTECRWRRNTFSGPFSTVLACVYATKLHAVVVFRWIGDGNREFCTSCSWELDLDPITFIYELDPYYLKLYPQTKNKLPTSSLSKVIVLQNRQTDRQTDRCHWKHHHVTSRVVTVDIFKC